MKKCKVCGSEINVFNNETCLSCSRWYFILYYQYRIQPYIHDWKLWREPVSHKPVNKK